MGLKSKDYGSQAIREEQTRPKGGDAKSWV